VSAQAITINAAARQRYLLVLLFAGFVLTGLEITLSGPMLPLFISRWSLNDSQAGIFFAVEFSASLAGVWLSSLITHYLGSRTSLVLGYAFMTAGLTTVNASSMTVVLFALGALGIGYGLVVPPTNLAVAEIGGARSASLVSLVNLAWGSGAASCSLLVTFALKYGFLTRMLYVSAGLGALLAFFIIFAELPKREHPTADVANKTVVASTGLKTTLVLAALFFLYVGVEVSLGSWAAAHAKRLSGGGTFWSTLAPMFFYGGLLVGRASGPFILARVREYRLVMSALIVVSVAITLLVLATRQGFAFASMVLAGLGCATVFPVYIAWLSRWYGVRAVRLGGLMFSMSSVGSAVGPWFVGFVSDHAGGLRVGLLVPLASAVAMIFLLLLVRRQATA
jgi:fucose permease